jgi:hypothetical protein
LLRHGRFLSFLILYAVGRIPWTKDRPVSRPLSTHRTTQTQINTHTSIHPVRLESTALVSGRAKTVHALDRAGKNFRKKYQNSAWVALKWKKLQGTECLNMQAASVGSQYFLNGVNLESVHVMLLTACFPYLFLFTSQFSPGLTYSGVKRCL